MVIRQAEIEDADNLAELISQVESNSEFMLYEPGEREITPQKQRKMIEALNKQENSTILVVEMDNRLVGYLFAIGGNSMRSKHTAYLVIGILPTHRGKGIGSSLFSTLNQWAKKEGVRRLELTVVTENEAGVSLYEKSGFEIEGIKKDSLFINNQFVDEYYMAKII